MKKSLRYTFEYMLPVLVLVYISVNTAYYFFFRAYTGINVDNSSGDVIVVDIPSNDDAAVRMGDTILRIDGKSYDEFLKNLDAPYPWLGYQTGEKVPVTVLRDGREQEKYHVLPPLTLPVLGSRLLSQWFMSYLFYIAGLMGLWFIRPRNSQRILFVLFNFVIAIWFSASLLSGPHELGAQYVLRAAFWLWLPIAWHFHWVFPRPLRNLPVWILGTFYVVCILMAIAQVTLLLPKDTYLISFLLAILGIIVLLLVHVFTQPDFRRLAWQVRSLFFYLLLPIGAATILYFLSYGQGYYFGPLALLGISALPGFYFFILYFQNNLMAGQNVQRLFRLYTWITLTGILAGVAYAIAVPFLAEAGFIFANYFILILIGLMFINLTPLVILPALTNPTHTGAEESQMQIRANRVADGVIFIFLMVLLGSVTGVVLMLVLQPAFEFIIPPLVALVVGIASLWLYTPFQRWFERRVLNIPIQPERLLERYSERILTSLDQSTLVDLFLQEVLPAWLIRQFALLQWDGKVFQPLITLGVGPEQMPLTPTSPVDWARVVSPLALQGRTVGLMLFGRRDPDDFYAVNEIAVLRQIANLTALGLANIRQSASLLEMYQTDIERQEVERTTLAAELHDDVLQHMALLSNQLVDVQAPPALFETYQYTANRIREITSGLRTPLLTVGLVGALEGLVEAIQDRELKNVSVFFEVSGNEVHLEERLELHLFRLVQQALDNALQHAHASEIRLGGTVSQTVVDLVISDNGIGFASGEKLDISSLLANKHFGIAGMFERAVLVGAEMSIQSQSGQGCQVRIHWTFH
jgi:signal transduction histidine kinase